MRFTTIAAAFVAGVILAFGATWGVHRLTDRSMSASEVERVVERYLRENPQTVVDAIRTYQARAEKAQREEQKQLARSRWQELAHHPDDPVIGNPNGDVTLVEFFDYRCGYCRRSFDELLALIREDPQLRVVLKEFPILGPDSVVAAQASLAALRQGKYAELHTAMMREPGQLDELRIYDIAAEVGLDVDKLRRDMDAPEVEATIRRNLALARELGVKGTPFFFSRNDLIPGAAGADALRGLIAGARKASS